MPKLKELGMISNRSRNTISYAFFLGLSAFAIVIACKACLDSNGQLAMSDSSIEIKSYEIEPCYEVESGGLHASLKFVARTDKAIVLRYSLQRQLESQWVLRSEETVLVYFYDSHGKEIKHIDEECLLGDEFANFKKHKASDDIKVDVPKNARFVAVGMGGARLITKPPMPIPDE